MNNGVTKTKMSAAERFLLMKELHDNKELYQKLNEARLLKDLRVKFPALTRGRLLTACEAVGMTPAKFQAQTGDARVAALEGRVRGLETELAVMKTEFVALKAALGGS